MAYKRVRRTYNDDGIFFCDTEADIEQLPQVGHVKIGSRAFVGETSQPYVLAKSGWQPVETPSGGGSGSDSGEGGTAKLAAKELADGDLADTEKLFNLSTGLYYSLANDGELINYIQGVSIPADEMMYGTVIDTNGKVKYINLFVAGHHIDVTITPEQEKAIYVDGYKMN
jgi:hypothetical protein